MSQKWTICRGKGFVEFVRDQGASVGHVRIYGTGESGGKEIPDVKLCSWLQEEHGFEKEPFLLEVDEVIRLCGEAHGIFLQEGLREKGLR